MRCIDCYTSNDLDGFPTSTYKVDIPEGELDAALLELSKFFSEVREVTETNGQSIRSLDAGFYYTDDVEYQPHPNAIRRLC